MKFVYEAPVVQVARMESVDDWRWLLKSLNDGVLFTRVVCVPTGHQSLLSLEDLRIDGKDLIVDRKVRMFLGKTYVVWNQSDTGYIVKCSEVFTEKRIPVALLANVLVRGKS